MNERDVTVSAKPTATDLAIDKWVTGFVYNSAIARNTDAWNRLHEILPELKKQVNQAVDQPAPVTQPA